MTLKKSMFVVACVVVPLSLNFHFSFSEELFYVLFPGIAVQMIITGGHGGSLTGEALAPFVGAAVNISIYALLLFWITNLGKSKTIQSDIATSKGDQSRNE